MQFDPSTARLVEPVNQFDPATAVPVQGPSTRQILSATSLVAPDVATEAERLAKLYGTTTQSVLADLPTFKRQEEIDRADAALSRSPVLSDVVRQDPYKAPQVRDDLVPLSTLAEMVESFKRGLAATRRGSDTGNIVEAVEVLSLIGRIERGELPTDVDVAKASRYASMFAGVGRTPENLARMRQVMQQRIADNVADYANRTREIEASPPSPELARFQSQAEFGPAISALGQAPVRIATQVMTESLGALLPALPIIAAGGIAGGPFGLAATTGLSSASIEYLNALPDIFRELKVDINDIAALERSIRTPEFFEKNRQAMIKAGVIGAFDAATAGLAGVRLATRPAANVAAQVGVQMAGGAAGEATGSVASGQEVSAAAVLSEMIGEVPGAMIDLGTQALRRASEMAGQAQEATAASDTLQAALQTAAESKLRQRSPEEFRAVLEQMGRNTDGTPTQIYVDGEVLNQLAPDVRQLLPQAVQEQIQRAAEIGDTVAIPVADVLTAAPGTALEQVLVENARLRPDAMTQAEARAAGDQAAQYLQQEARRVIEQARDQEAMRTSAEAVRTSILGELNATGRYRPQVNEAMSQWAGAFYTTMAGRVGITPEEFYQRYRLRVLGEAPAGQGPVIEQGRELDRNGIPVATMAEVQAVADIPTVEKMAQAMDLLGEAEFERRVQARMRSLGATTPEQQAMVTESVAINAVAIDRADAARGETGVLEQSVTTMVPTTKGAVVDPAIVKVPGIAEAEADDPKAKAALAANVELFNAKVQSIADELKRGYNSIKVEGDTPKAQAESIINQMVRNLLTIYDAIPPEIRDRSRLWYDGANRIALAFAQRYDMTPMQAAAQLAVLSPQADWFMNVSYAERINDILEFQQDYTWDAEMEAWATDWMAASEESRQKEAERRAQSVRDAERALRDAERTKARAETALEKNTPKLEEKIRAAEAALAEAHTATVEARKLAKKSGSKVDEKALAKAEAREKAASDKAKEARADLREAKGAVSKAGTAVRQAEKKLQERREFAAEPDPNVAVQPNVRGKKLSELETDFERAWWVRTYDEAHHPRAYRIVTPEGGFLGFAKNDDGVTDGTIAWKSFNPIAKAIGIRRDGSLANVHAALGGEHKVRNFYNNIYDPDAPQPFVTSDTHQVAANLFLPLGADALEVGQNFGGTGTKSVGATGLNGTYWLYSEAVARAAAEVSKRGDGKVLPREMQSISWEAIRSLFSPTFKGDAASVNAVRDLWDKYTAGEATYEDTIQAVINLAGGRYRDPSWVGVRPDSAAAPEAGLKSYESQLAHARQGLAERREPGRGDAGLPGSTLSQGGVSDQGPLEQAGDGAGRDQGRGLAPLEGAPNVAGASGPDPRLVAVAEQYARDNGIPLRRQGEYAQVDPERAARIAAAYDAMVHSPQDPAVREAYENLIQQTLAQYRALEAAGYRFYLIDESNDPYGGNPWNAMRDLRANQAMGVFATEAGFGSGATELNVEDNPLLADTGLRWPYGSPDGEPKRVLANDLFRAVHDAFGHGLEGAGFRAQGEENAWQAHIRLFTGSARGAITSETRGQNSWLNFGPYGESNRNAKVEDTVFADQKTGLMPEWTWSEGIVEDMPDEPLAQGPRGTFNPRTLELVLSPTADLSTFFHETGHFFLEVMGDVASQPDAPAMIQEDMSKILAWFGVPDLATWNSMTLDQQRPYHERWAESIEQYVMEGRAPSVELAPVMRRFSAWLKSVYQSIKQFLAGRPDAERQPLNDDIRRVMDRMLAADEQIQQANEVAGFMPDEQADGEAAERLQKRSMADLKWAVKARDKVIAKLKREAREIEKTIRTEVTAEVEQRPEVLAKAAIEKAEKEFEADPVSADMNIAAIADAFGYPSVEAMYRAIDAFGDKRETIDGIVERRMLEENGDLIDERAIREAANEAVHNEARAKSLATELRSQQEMLGQRRDTGETTASGARRTVNVLVEAAKQFGASVIARTPLRDLRATAWKHTSAERRAGKRWQEATMAGDTQAAVKAKQDQMLNNAAAKAALDAAAEAKKILEFFARVTKGTDEKTVEKGRDPDIVNAARAVLAAYGVQTPASKGAAAYLETLKSNDPETYAALEPMMAAAMANAQPLEALTFEELTGLHESIQAFWFMAKRSRQMEVDGNLLDIDDVAQELFARMEQIGIPDRIPGEGMAVTRAEERGLFLKQGIAFLRRVEAWAEGMDGKYGGPFLRFVFQPIKDAADRYRKDRLDYRKRFQALVDNLAPIVDDSIIEAPELGYTFGTPGSTAGTAMNEILHAIAHTGNDSNKRKLLLGRGWATENADGTLNTTAWDAFIRRLVNEGKLQEAHFDFVQGVWDLLEDTKPLAQKAHRDAFGRYFSEVTANEFVDPFGVTRRGGYLPAQVDTRLVKDNVLRKMAEEQNNSMAYAFPQPAKGFTISRTEYNQPLMLDLRSLSQHIDKVLLFGHMTNPARDVRKLITRKTVSQPLDRIQPATIEAMLQPWLQRSAQQVVETPIVGTGRWARLPGIIRSRAGMALMFANVSNAVQQITGLANAAVRVKPAFMMRSLAQYVANPREFSRAVWGASPYMDDRAKNEVAVLNEQMQAILLKPSTFERAQDFSMRHAYFLQTALDNVLSPIVWNGAFNQGLADGMSDADAVRFADSTVRQTQGSTLPEDVSRLETGPAYARVFTQFVGYFNMMANTNATALKQIIGEVGLKKGAGRALYVVMMGLMVPIWAAEAIAIAFRGGPEDEDDDGWLDDWLAEVFGMGTLKGMLAQIPIVGQFAVAGLQRFNDNPLDDRVSLSPAVSLIESSVGAPQSVYKAIVDEGSAQKAIRDVATLVSVATGVPLYGVARPIGYAAGVAQGRIEPEGPLDVARGLITGTASPESRVP